MRFRDPSIGRAVARGLGAALLALAVGGAAVDLGGQEVGAPVDSSVKSTSRGMIPVVTEALKFATTVAVTLMYAVAVWVSDPPGPVAVNWTSNSPDVV